MALTPIASRRIDPLKLGEVEVNDCLQGLGNGALGQIGGKAVEPCPVFLLQIDQLGDGVAPTLRAAAAVAKSPASHLGAAVCMSRAVWQV